jgi:Na+/phosphate symporter
VTRLQKSGNIFMERALREEPSEMVEEFFETYIEIEKIAETRERERINNRFSQKIAEIKRLQEQLDTNIHNLKALIIKEIDSGSTVIVNDIPFSRQIKENNFEYVDIYNIESVIVDKKGDKLE